MKKKRSKEYDKLIQASYWIFEAFLVILGISSIHKFVPVFTTLLTYLAELLNTANPMSNEFRLVLLLATLWMIGFVINVIVNILFKVHVIVEKEKNAKLDRD